MAQLRERQAPAAKVYAYIKDPVYGGANAGTRASRRLVELLGFRSVSSTLSRSSNGSATVVFPNYKSCLIRYVSANAIAATEQPNNGQETTNAYANKFIQQICAENSAGRLFKGLWNDLVLSDGNLSQVTPDAFTPVRHYSRSRGDLATGADANAMAQILANGYIMALPFINWMDPIFIDYQGQDGLWYAGFTGMVSRVTDSYSKTGDQSITVNCGDMSMLFGNVSIVSGWNRMSVAEQNSSLNDFVYATEANQISASQGAFTNIFESFHSVTEIISELVKRSQDMWRLENKGARLFGADIGVQAFKFDTKIYPYEGISGRRGSIQRDDAAEDPANMNPSSFLTYTDDNLQIKHYMCDESLAALPNGVIRGSKKILVDPLIMKFDQLFIHKMLNNSLALYKDSLVSADQILNDLVAKMYAYKYFDGNGNLIIELARPNAFPNIKTYGGRSTSTIIIHEVPSQQQHKPAAAVTPTARVIPGDTPASFAFRNGITVQQLLDFNGANNTFIFDFVTNKSGTTTTNLRVGTFPIIGTAPQSKGALDALKNLTVVPSFTGTITPDAPDQSASYKDQIAWTTLNFHGKNYILSPDDLNSFTATFDESPLTTLVATDAIFPFFDSNGNLVYSSSSLHGVAVADFDKLSKLGVRRYQIQSIYNVTWPSLGAGSRVLSYQSAAVLERVNALADTSAVGLSHRPDLQLGRTVINPLRMKSYIIESVTNSWSPGAPHSTNLSATYGHPIHKTLEVPWLAIFNEPELFFGSAGINALSTIQAVGSDGVPIGDTSEVSYKGAGSSVFVGNDSTILSPSLQV